MRVSGSFAPPDSVSPGYCELLTFQDAEVHYVQFARELLIAQIHAQLTQTRNYSHARAQTCISPSAAELYDQSPDYAQHSVPSPLPQLLNGSFVQYFKF